MTFPGLYQGGRFLGVDAEDALPHFLQRNDPDTILDYAARYMVRNYDGDAYAIATDFIYGAYDNMDVRRWALSLLRAVENDDPDRAFMDIEFVDGTRDGETAHLPGTGESIRRSGNTGRS